MDDCLKDFLFRQRKRVQYQLAATERRIRERREGLLVTDVETRQAAGAHTCCSTRASHRSIDTVIELTERNV